MGRIDQGRFQALLGAEFARSLTKPEARELAALKAEMAQQNLPAVDALRSESAQWHAEANHLMDAAKSELAAQRPHAANRSKTKSTGSF